MVRGASRFDLRSLTGGRNVTLFSIVHLRIGLSMCETLFFLDRVESPNRIFI